MTICAYTLHQPTTVSNQTSHSPATGVDECVQDGNILGGNLGASADKDLGWREASFLAAKAAGCGNGFARSLRAWVWDYLEDETSLPNSEYGNQKLQIHDEAIAQEIQLHLQSLKKKYFTAMDIVRFLDQPEVKARLKFPRTPTEHTCWSWLYAMEYHFSKSSKGMYIHGHECEDVVEYCQNIFLPQWAELEPRMMKWSANDDVTIPDLHHIGEKQVILVTHDESRFYANDRRAKRWLHSSEKPEPVGKELGWLKSKDGTRKTCILFKAGTNRDGYFNCEDLCSQVLVAINLFEEHFPGGSTVAAFGFDNAHGHQKHPDNALSARHMPKKTQHWWGTSGKCIMRNGILPDGTPQDFYYPDNHPQYPGLFN
ncbi:hypothetical protein M422DRAFT_266316 [Sphaerobolus stellatus SS14]|uniref:Uncharacterized protein n=1 Tax=Sphaerobolus stellatus (strain SS14) TaxID=990650 RepID=A0A0C9URY7_SPHS4|nr:hypothetical protein M422DRAFT_266316 [Sphaerobolus stellatus SS14]